jgi:glutaredoxin 3
MLHLYIKTWCPWCVAAIEALDALGCSYTLHDVEKDSNGAATVRAISGQSKVPTMRAGGAVLADFGPEEVEPFLRKLGLVPDRP